MKVRTIGVYGVGVVGQALVRSYIEHAEVKAWDRMPERRTHPREEVLASDIVFVALPTPANANGSCDTRAIDLFLSGLAQDGRLDMNIVIRSTVPVGFTRRMAELYGLRNLVHSPEFLTARTAMVDAQMPARNVIGYPFIDREDKGVNARVCNVVYDLYAERFPSVPVHVMSSDESEAVKLCQNTLAACTVTMWNELQDACARMGCEWETVRRGILADGHFSPALSNVPGPDGKMGWGGACYGKDIRNFITCAVAAGAPAIMAQTAVARNDCHDRERTS